MDFLTLPPEVNSSRMYAGPGSEPMLAAAAAWETLAAELHSAANSYQSVVSGLTAGPWQGPSSATMAAAAAAYAAWMSATARQAEQTASQARVAADAYQTAFAATVPPQMVAANRSLLMRLVATNVFGQNTAAIATTEAQYTEMWTQDATAMSGYSASSAAATTLTPFTPPQQNTNPGGSASQSNAVGQATSTSAGNAQSTVSSIQRAFSVVPNALGTSSSSSSLDTVADLISIFLDLPADIVGIFVDVPLGVLGIVSIPLDIGGFGTGLHTDDIVSGWNGVQPWPNDGPAPLKELPAPLTNRPAGTIVPRVAAGLSEANSVGMLSVPATWTAATPAVRPIAVTLPALQANAGGQAGEAGLGGTLSQMGLGGMVGRAMAGTVGGRGRGGTTPKGARAAARAAAAAADTGDSAAPDGADEATQTQARTVVTGVAAELREFAKLRDEGILTDEEYAEQKSRLLGR